MKKALSLVLAVLMLLGCVSFSAFAAEVEFYYMPDVLESYGVETIKLTEKKTPTLDGQLTSADEYTFYINEGEQVDVSGTNDVASGNEKIVEGFAYDDEYVYYYYYGGRSNNNNWCNDLRIQATLPNTSVGAILAQDQPFTMGTWYRMWVSNWAPVEGNSFTNAGATKNPDFSTCGGEFAGHVDNVALHTFEVKISRKYLDEAAGQTAGTVRAYAMYTVFRFGNYGTNVVFGTPLTGDAATALGTTYVPRYLVLDDVARPEPKAYDVVSTLVENGHNAVDVKNTDATRVVDGDIQYGEYSVTEEVAASSVLSGSAYVDHTRYYAMDDDYFYYAIKGNFDPGYYVGLRIRPFGSSVSEADMPNVFNSSKYSWYNVDVNADGTVTERTNNTSPLSGTFMTYDQLESEAGGSYDAETGVTVIEWKIGRDYIENAYGVDDVKAYMFYNNFWSGNIVYGDTALSEDDKTDLGVSDAPCSKIALVDDRVNVVDTFAKNGVNNIYIPKATTVSMDGVIGEGEYLVGNKINSDVQKEFVGAGNYVAQNLTEYFAYDDNYLYFAFAGDVNVSGIYLDQQQIRLRPSSELLTAEEMAKDFELGTNYNWYAFQMLIKGDMAQAGNFRTGADTSKYYKWSDGDNSITYNYTNGYADAVIEIKINKNRLSTDWGYADDASIYAYYYKPTSDFGAYYGTKLDAELQAELGTTATQAPRYIVLGEAAPATIDAASIRISTLEDGTGLRFKTVVDKSRLAVLQKQYGEANVTVGTLIAPLDTLALDAGLTHSAGEAGVDYLDIPATVAEPFATTYNSNIYAGSITAIKEANLDRNFAAVGYIAVVDGGATFYYYTETAVSRNVDYVASAALADTSATQAGDYQYVVDANAETPVYSPYTESQRAILATLVKA